MLKTGSERAKSSRCERDGPKIKHPKQGATRVRGVFQQPVSRFVVLFFYLLCCTQPVSAAPSKEDALHFQIPLVSGLEKHLDLLAYPAYLMVALENNRIRTSNLGRPVLVDERTIQFKNAALRFVNKKAAVYSYVVSVDWDIPLKRLKLEIPVEIDATSVMRGNIQVRVFLPLVSFSPKELLDRINAKVQLLSAPEIQNIMLGYLDELAKKNDGASGAQELLPKIMMESYNLPANAGGVCTSGEPGDAESLSDQAYILATLAIWFLIGPILVIGFSVWRQRKFVRQKDIGR